MSLALTRRKFLSSLPLIGATPVYAFGVEPKWLERTFHQIRLPLRDLGSGVRILHLSDFHASPVVPFSLIEQAVEYGLAVQPDLICLTGDFVTDSHGFDEQEYGRILSRLSTAAPTFACLGNHDGGRWAVNKGGGFRDTTVVRGLLDASGVSLLHNRSELVPIRGQSLRIVGVPDLWSHAVNGHLAFEDAQPGEPTILLAHNPDTKDFLADRPWDLMLSGHTHGGQVLVPLVGTRFIPVQDKRFIAGLKEWNGRQVYVTRGVGSLAGVRFNCRPEVTVLQITG
jgi:predicted MPP superfamily phosphohydrolase